MQTGSDPETFVSVQMTLPVPVVLELRYIMAIARVSDGPCETDTCTGNGSGPINTLFGRSKG